MLTRLITKIFIIFACLSIYSCTQSDFDWSKNKEYYKALLFRSEPFVNYHVIAFTNIDNKLFYFLSKRISTNDIPPFKNYERIRTGDFYKLTLNKIDSVVVLKSRAYVKSIYFADKEVKFWSEDTVRVPVYSSDNVFGLYVEIIE